MSEMIERVARAMCCINEPCGFADEPHECCVPLHQEQARAAIAAMREPTFDPETVSYHEGMTRRDWWRAMIDKALA